MHRVELFYETLSSAEIELLAGLGSVKSFTTGSQAVPPIVGDSTSSPRLPIPMQPFPMSWSLMMVHSPRLFSIGVVLTISKTQVCGTSQSLGSQPAGSGSLDISGFESGQIIFYQVQAKGSSYSDWSDKSGQFRTVSSPTVVSASAVNQTTSSAVLRGEVLSNGGESVLLQLPVPLVSQDLIAH